MRQFVMMVAGLALCAGAIYAARVYAQNNPARDPGAAAAAAPVVDSKDAAVIASYGIGQRTGRSIKDDGVDVDLEAFIQGIKDGAAGAKPKYSEQQVRAAFMIFQKNMQAKEKVMQTKEEAKQKVAGEKNLREGQAFLAKNKTKAGVKTTASGLQYEVLRAGAGATPKASDTVKVHYEGTLLDGTVFDSSIKRNEPAVFPVGGVIPGWTEALQLMKVGDKWRVFIPSELAYGARGAGRDIGPNAVLAFEVELLGIEPPAKAGAGQE
jgi:FKBP-type peptidyl-prolyl cis-trans isomerase FklB